jgi:hypothetical protein
MAGSGNACRRRRSYRAGTVLPSRQQAGPQQRRRSRRATSAGTPLAPRLAAWPPASPPTHTPPPRPLRSFLLQLGQLDRDFALSPPTKQALAAMLLANETYGYSAAWGEVLAGRYCYGHEDLAPAQQLLKRLQAGQTADFLRRLWLDIWSRQRWAALPRRRCLAASAAP